MIMIIKTNIFGELGEIAHGCSCFASREWQAAISDRDVVVLAAA